MSELPTGVNTPLRLLIMNAEPRLRNTIEQVLLREGLHVVVLDGGHEGFHAFPENDVVQKGRLTLRIGERRALFDNKDIPDLTPKEYALLKELALRSPRVVEKIGLVIKICGIPLEQLGRKTLDVHIQRLRRKLGRTGSPFLKTVSLIGYQWLDLVR